MPCRIRLSTLTDRASCSATARSSGCGELGARARLHAHARSSPIRASVATGLVDRARRRSLEAAGIAPFVFHDFDANPTSAWSRRAARRGRARRIDSIVALGGGSSLDCAKGINFVLTNGGTMRDYRGFGKAAQPMLPSIGVPTTAGTGSEAQSYAIISDAETHAKMACGDPKAAFRVAILDPALTVSQPRAVTAIAGYDAISHAVESYVTHAAQRASRICSRATPGGCSTRNYERVLDRAGRSRRRAARCCSARTRPASPSSSRCSARRTRAPTR